MEHKTRIIPGETVFQTGKNISYLRYDSLEELLSGITEGLKDQAEKDRDSNKPKLAKMGFGAVKKTEELKEIVNQMWKISEPKMK